MHTAGGPAVPFELELLVGAHRYQEWLVDVVRSHLGRRVLEVGSGIGNMSRHLPVGERLVLSEISPHMAKVLAQRVPPQGARSIALVSPSDRLAKVFAQENFDTVLSFNVLEHVGDDQALIRDCLELLRASKAAGPKRIVTVVPAHQFAYGEVDRAFEHLRRYSTGSYRRLLESAGSGPLSSENFYSRYMNLPGLLGWWLNGRVLGRRRIGRGCIHAFELLCPVIRPIDDFLHERLRLPLGNSLVAVYKL